MTTATELVLYRQRRTLYQIARGPLRDRKGFRPVHRVQFTLTDGDMSAFVSSIAARLLAKSGVPVRQIRPQVNAQVAQVTR